MCRSVLYHGNETPETVNEGLRFGSLGRWLIGEVLATRT